MFCFVLAYYDIYIYYVILYYVILCFKYKYILCYMIYIFHVFSTHTFLLCHHKYHHDHGYFTFRAAGTPRCTRSLEAMLRWKLFSVDLQRDGFAKKLQFKPSTSCFYGCKWGYHSINGVITI